MRKILAVIMTTAILFTMSTSAVEATVIKENSNTSETTPSGIPYEDIGEEIENFVAEREDGLASMEVAVFDSNKTLYTGYFGYSDIENAIKADKNTVYEWGSSSKIFVWISVMQLYEQGRIDLEEDIREYLPDGFMTKTKYDEPITMRNLMTHTAGFEEIDEEAETTNESQIRDLETVLRETEPKQIYKPGTVTSYSNWGCSLAAFIVQCVSGENYSNYVHEHILEPLGMEHTAVRADYTDNVWAKKQRNNLKTYSIMQDSSESYGTRISYIELYPAGAAIGTLEDFTKLAKAFVPEDGEKCILFEKDDTLDYMLSATSYYGDSDIPRNCHGLWTLQYAVDVIGHSGNTKSCSAQLMFDPESGVGIVVLANEEGESAFSYGLLSLIYGSYKDNERVRNAEFSNSIDISGIYAGSRTTYTQGCMRIFTYTFFTPIIKTKNPNQFKLLGEDTIIKVAEHQYLYDNGNGLQYLMYETQINGHFVLESYTMDEIRHNVFNYISIVMMIFIAFISIVILLIKFIKSIIKRIMNKTEERSRLNISLTFQQIIFSLIGILFLAFLSIVTEGKVDITDTMIICFCIGFASLAIFSFANVIVLIVRTWKILMLKTPILKTKKQKKIVAKNIITILGALFIVGFVAYFQLYNFWS